MKLKNITYEGAGIENVYSNESWLIALKNWREANDVENISRLEIHFKTDEQFILLKGSVVIIYAEELDEQTIIQAVKLEPGAVFNVPQNTWFNNILSKDAKLAYTICKNLSVIRPSRNNPRNTVVKHAVSFLYRVA